jgi:hypothetical protein
MSLPLLTTLANRSTKFVRDLKEISRLVTDPKLSQSYYPSEPRKSKSQIALDLLSWYLKSGDVNNYYYVYGFDRRRINTEQYLPYPEFRTIRNQRNYHPNTRTGFNYVCILQDKFVFSQFLSSLGVPTPKSLALCNPETIVWLDSMRTDALESINSDASRQFDGFCKPLNGINGTGAFPLRLSDGQLYVDNEHVNAGEVKRRINGSFLLQERVTQHPAVSELHSQSINTLRILTFNNGESVQVFSAAQRIGTNGRNVDNWTAGGILVGIDLHTGNLRAEGFYKPGYGGKVLRHPQTGVELAGFNIPHFSDAVQLVKKVHGYLYGVHSIGWDIAISPAGPVIIEGNDDWDGAVPMALEENFRQRFLELYASDAPPALKR